MNVLDLFSGIGGFSLGLERAGMRTVAFCEIEPYCRAVLAEHWPHVPCYDDVRTLTGERLKADGISVDVICGGFPCQDISFAGKGAGLAGERSGLWREYARIIGEVRPRYVIVENVAALLNRGLADVLGDLAALGFDAEWHCIPASAVGAPHRRDRIWIVAFDADCGNERALKKIHSQNTIASGICQKMADAKSDGRQPRRVRNATQEPRRRQLNRSCVSANDVANTSSTRPLSTAFTGVHCGEASARARHVQFERCNWWLTEPDVGRVAHGVPSRVDRLRGLGNAVVPQIPEIIGKAILQAEGRLAA